MPVTLKAYKYCELRLKKAKQKVIQWWRESEWKNGGNPCIHDDIKMVFEEYLAERGLPTNKIHWSFGHCQGDGMAFYGDIDVQKYMDFYKLRSWGPMEDFLKINIYDIDTHYCHWNTMRVEHEGEDDMQESEHPQAFWMTHHVEKLLEHIRDEIKTVSRHLEARGYEIIESYESDEYIDEELKNQDHLLFTWQGDLVPA